MSAIYVVQSTDPEDMGAVVYASMSRLSCEVWISRLEYAGNYDITTVFSDGWVHDPRLGAGTIRRVQ